MANGETKNFWLTLMAIDRRVIFAAVIIAVSLPLFLDITQKIYVSPEVRDLYESLEQLAPGSKVLLSFDYDPPSAPELQPMAVTVIEYCLRNDLKMIIIGLWPQGPQQANQALESVVGQPPGESFEYKGKRYVYGEDWVNLGFQEGREFVIQRMGSSITAAFPRDYSGTPVEQLPLMRGISNFNNIDYVFNLSAGYPGTVEWVQLAGDRFHATIGAANTAVQAPMVYPYYRAGQLTGILGGMKGAAEFEAVVGVIGKGTKFMLSQSFAHTIVILFIIVGNIAYFASGRRKRL
ncbi:MAG: hypothetical protein Kow0074_17850 [Candidatus Zixiibacteriota bacterium]